MIEKGETSARIPGPESAVIAGKDRDPLQKMVRDTTITLPKNLHTKLKRISAVMGHNLCPRSGLLSSH
jgi:hypothetical protein